MKIKQFYLVLIILLQVSFIKCEEKRAIFAQNIRNYVHTLTKPLRTDELVSEFQNKLTIFFYTLTLKELDEIQVKYDLSDSIMLQIKSVQYGKISGMKKISETKNLNYYSHEESIGATLKENDGRISFALIKTKSFANLKIRYETYYEEECHRTWIFFQKCHDVLKQREKELTENEKIIVNKGAKYSAINSFLEAADILQKGDYELYMSDTGSIFSPDRQSVAHLTYFGNIAIGPTAELNSILPIDYEYNFKSNGNGHLIKSPTGNITELKYYPTTKKLKFDLTAKNGKFYKFNFLREGLTNFPGQYIYYMLEESKNGPFVLEVKNNGNVIFYSKKNPNNILWTTNTANKGKGPYNLYLTNDKKLILEDSNKEILYQYNDYIEAPTISYSIDRKNYFNNGLSTSNWYNSIKPIDIIITTDNKTLAVKFDAIKKVRRLKNYKTVTDDVVDMFSASSFSKGYSLCYTVEISCRGWTSIGCNGETLGVYYNYTGEQGDPGDRYCYIRNIILYFKRYNEKIPTISNNPQIVTIEKDYDEH